MWWSAFVSGAVKRPRHEMFWEIWDHVATCLEWWALSVVRIRFSADMMSITNWCRSFSICTMSPIDGMLSNYSMCVASLSRLQSKVCSSANQYATYWWSDQKENSSWILPGCRPYILPGPCVQSPLASTGSARVAVNVFPHCGASQWYEFLHARLWPWQPKLLK